METLFWNNSSKSGLCDRLIDLSLMSTYAKINNMILSLQWKSLNNGEKGKWFSDNKTLNFYNETRYIDYIFENFNTYFNVPNNINVIDDLKSLKKDFIVFNDYLGGVHSPISFHQKYLNNKISLEDFLKLHDETLKNFTPTKKLLDLIKDFEIPFLSVHLRRTDKLRIDSDDHSLFYSEIDELNKKTLFMIDKILEKNNYNIKLYFSSDDENEKKKYDNLYKDYIIKVKPIEKNFLQTYIDMYLLSKSDIILLSQKHSNFSIFTSLLNKNKLIFLYEKCPITEVKYDTLNNITYYEDFLKNE